MNRKRNCLVLTKRLMSPPGTRISHNRVYRLTQTGRGRMITIVNAAGLRGLFVELNVAETATSDLKFPVAGNTSLGIITLLFGLIHEMDDAGEPDSLLRDWVWGGVATRTAATSTAAT